MILVIDDNANHRALIEMELAEEGYDVVPVAGAGEALAAIARQRPEIIILDIRLETTGDGLTLLKKIKAMDATIPVVLYTGFIGFRDDPAAWSASGYVLKSSDMSELKACIAGALNCARDPKCSAARK